MGVHYWSDSKSQLILRKIHIQYWRLRIHKFLVKMLQQWCHSSFRPLIDSVDTIADGFNGGLQGQRERTRQGEDNLRHAKFTGTYHAIRDVSSQSLREPWEKRSWSITWLPTRGDQQIQCRHARMHNTHPKEGCRKLARCFCHERKWNTLERRISIYICIYTYILIYLFVPLNPLNLSWDLHWWG